MPSSNKLHSTKIKIDMALKKRHVLKKRKRKVDAPALTISQEASKALTTIPTEIQDMILKHLEDDPVSSLCLGLTCKHFMDWHKEHHPGPVPLNSKTFLPDGRERKLKILLRNWIPKDWVYNWETGLYVTPQVLDEQAERYRGTFELLMERFEDQLERDRERVAERKRDRRRYGYLRNQDEWSDFEAIDGGYHSDSFYEPAEGTCDGDSEHSRKSWLRRAALEDEKSSTSSDDERFGPRNRMLEWWLDDSEEENCGEGDDEMADLEESEDNSEHSD